MTAEEILLKHGWKKDIPGFTSLLWAMREYAEFHVKAAQEAGARSVDNSHYPDGFWVKEAYPLTNIK